MLQRLKQNIVLRKFRGRFDACRAYGLSPNGELAYAESRTSSIAFWLGLLAIIAVVLALMYGSHSSASPMMSFALAGVAGTLKTKKEEKKQEKAPANIRKMEADMKQLARELKEAQDEMAEGAVSQERGEEIEEKAKEMEDLQDHIDRYHRIAGINAKGREVKRVVMPDEDEDGIDRRAIATTAGHLFIGSDQFKMFQKSGAMSGFSGKVSVGRRFGKKVILRGEEAKAFEKKAFDPASLPILGTDAIIPIDHDPEIVRYQEPEILTIRDMLQVTPTTSDVVRYVKHIATTRGAATVARGGLKPFLKVEFEATNVNVETIAVLSKVTEQDISDAARLISYINGEMNLDVRVEEERQLAWGSGTNELLGLFAPGNAIPEFDRSAAGDTVIDIIRKMRTDLRKNRVTPNFVAVDPIDWEEVELTKGTDTHYIWGLITDLRGPRIWSLRVVESDAMTNPETGERRILEGDGIRGATLYDREDIQLAVGFMDDDFGRNLRTLRAEERLALAVKRNFAFEYAQTNEPES